MWCLCGSPSPARRLSSRGPPVVVSSSHYNLARPDVVVMAVTSQFGAPLSFGDIGIADWQMAGLLKPSAIKPVFATVERTLIVRRFGTLGETDISALRTAIASMIG